MPNSVAEFHEEFFQDLQGTADAEGRYLEDAFFEQFSAYLIEAGELDMSDRAHYAGRGVRVDGYGGDPADTDNVLSLLAIDFFPQNEVGTLTGTEMDAAFNRLLKFLQRALEPSFRNGLEETAAVYGLTDLISRRWSAVTKVRLFLLTNRQLSSRVDSRPEGEIDGVPVTFSVWDIDRLYRYAAVGHGREPIDIDLVTDYGGALPLLQAHLDDAGYEAYLAVIPGPQLAAIYDRWGARLLEQNVRSFLQARGKVNQRIRITLETTPEMFFAYNNGLSATAESVDTVQTANGLAATRFRNLQIVNGGQTTASVFAASKKKGIDLAKVFVQMKLSIVEPARTTEVVPRISEYANTQNRVNAADFFANHPFHVRIEEFSRRIYAPSPDGTFKQTKWFYERARGSYQDARAALTIAQRKKFDSEYPKAQLFTKTDLAKYLNVWNELPHVVSTGAQKNFVSFAERIGPEWEKQPDTFNEMYYREVIAKAIIFREVERLVSEQAWYQGGYRAQVVAFAIAKLARVVRARGAAVDFEAVWRAQTVGYGLRAALAIAAKVAFDVLSTPPTGMSNVTEWAKKVGCWEKVANASMDVPASLDSALVGYSERQHQRRNAVKEQKVLNGIEAQIRVVQLGPDFWRQLYGWARERKLLSESEIGILETAALVPDHVPSDKQCIRAMETLARMEQEGWTGQS